MTKNTWLITLLVVLNLVSLGALWLTTNERDKPDSKKDHRAMLHQVFTEELNLDETQQASFKDLTREHFQKRKEQTRIMGDKKRQLVEAVAAETEDSLKIQTLVDEILIVEKANEELFIEHLRNLKAVCTPEQQQNLARVLLRGMRPHGSPRHDEN